MIKEAIHKVFKKENLTYEEAEAGVSHIRLRKILLLGSLLPCRLLR